MKTETIEQFLARGGNITQVESASQEDVREAEKRARRSSGWTPDVQTTCEGFDYTEYSMRIGEGVSHEEAVYHATIINPDRK